MNNYITNNTSHNLLSGIADEINGFELEISRQSEQKPKIDDVICKYLDGETLKNALSFIEYIKNSNMKIKWSAPGVWQVKCRSRRVLDILVKSDAWQVRLAYDHIGRKYAITNFEQEKARSLINALKESAPLAYAPDANLA